MQISLHTHHDRLCSNIACKTFLFTNSDNKSKRSLVSTPTHGGDALGKELTRDSRLGSSGLNLAFKGLLLGVSLHLQAMATSSNPHKLSLQVCNARAQREGGSAVVLVEVVDVGGCLMKV
jgi:hypothetical protein